MPADQTPREQPDWLVEYKTSVRALLFPPEVSSKHKSVSILLWPSFHGETGIFVSKTDKASELEIRMLSSSYWYHSQHKTQVVLRQPKNDWPEPSEPHLLTESITLGENEAEAFWKRADDCCIWTTPDGSNFGLDGMSVDVETTSGSASNTFHAWSPEPTSPQGRCVDIVFQLAWQVARQIDSVKRLEEIFGYIYDSIPKRELPGPPRTLRIFGSLSSSQEGGLIQTLNEFGTEPVLIVDMSNFESMGTLLHPVFQRFAERDGRTAWIVNDAARGHLTAAGVDAEALFEDSSAASAWLLQ